MRQIKQQPTHLGTFNTVENDYQEEKRTDTSKNLLEKINLLQTQVEVLQTEKKNWQVFQQYFESQLSRFMIDQFQQAPDEKTQLLIQQINIMPMNNTATTSPQSLPISSPQMQQQVQEKIKGKPKIKTLQSPKSQHSQKTKEKVPSKIYENTISSVKKTTVKKQSLPTVFSPTKHQVPQVASPKSPKVMERQRIQSLALQNQLELNQQIEHFRLQNEELQEQVAHYQQQEVNLKQGLANYDLLCQEKLNELNSTQEQLQILEERFQSIDITKLKRLEQTLQPLKAQIKTWFKRQPHVKDSNSFQNTFQDTFEQAYGNLYEINQIFCQTTSRKVSGHHQRKLDQKRQLEQIDDHFEEVEYHSPSPIQQNLDHNLQSSKSKDISKSQDNGIRYWRDQYTQVYQQLGLSQKRLQQNTQQMERLSSEKTLEVQQVKLQLRKSKEEEQSLLLVIKKQKELERLQDEEIKVLRSQLEKQRRGRSPQKFIETSNQSESAEKIKYLEEQLIISKTNEHAFEKQLQSMPSNSKMLDRQQSKMMEENQILVKENNQQKNQIENQDNMIKHLLHEFEEYKNRSKVERPQLKINIQTLEKSHQTDEVQPPKSDFLTEIARLSLEVLTQKVENQLFSTPIENQSQLKSISSSENLEYSKLKKQFHECQSQLNAKSTQNLRLEKQNRQLSQQLNTSTQELKNKLTDYFQHMQVVEEELIQKKKEINEFQLVKEKLIEQSKEFQAKEAEFQAMVRELEQIRSTDTLRQNLEELRMQNIQLAEELNLRQEIKHEVDSLQHQENSINNQDYENALKNNVKKLAMVRSKVTGLREKLESYGSQMGSLIVSKKSTQTQSDPGLDDISDFQQILLEISKTMDQSADIQRQIQYDQEKRIARETDKQRKLVQQNILLKMEVKRSDEWKQEKDQLETKNKEQETMISKLKLDNSTLQDLVRRGTVQAQEGLTRRTSKSVAQNPNEVHQTARQSQYRATILQSQSLQSQESIQLKKELGDAQEIIASLYDRLGKNETKTLNEKELLYLNKRVGDLQKQLKEKASQYEKLEKLIDELQKDYEKKIEDMGLDIAVRDSRLSELHQEIIIKHQQKNLPEDQQDLMQKNITNNTGQTSAFGLRVIESENDESGTSSDSDDHIPKDVDPPEVSVQEQI